MAKKKQVKDIKKLTDVFFNDDEVIGKVTEVVNREELEKSNTGNDIDIITNIQFTCVSVISGSKGAKTANFYQNKENGYNRNKPLVLLFEPNEECKFEAGKKYNFIISEL